MAGWDTSSEEVYVERVEEILDKNPDLYKQRTIAALNEKRYREALNEAQTALKYGNNALEYHVLVVRVLFEMKQYEVCFKYLKKSGLWKLKDSSDLLPDEQNYIYYVYGVCYQECGYSLREADLIIITPDGKGMYKNIQTAIKCVDENTTLFLTDGEYSGNIHIKNKAVQFETTDSANVILLNCEMEITNSTVELYNIKFRNNICEEEYVIKINNSKAALFNLKISGNGNQNGIYLYNNSNVIVKDSSFSGLQTCLTKEVGKGTLRVEGSVFTDSDMGIVATDVTTVRGCEIKNMTDSAIVPVITKGEEITVFNSNLHDNKLGVKIINSIIEFTECIISNNRYNITFIDGGVFMANDTDIIGAKCSAFLTSRDTKRVRKEEEYVAFIELDGCRIMRNCKETEDARGGLTLYRKHRNTIWRDNDVVGSSIEGVKGTLNSISNMAYGKDFTLAGFTKDVIEETGEMAVDFLGKLFK